VPVSLFAREVRVRVGFVYGAVLGMMMTIGIGEHTAGGLKRFFVPR